MARKALMAKQKKLLEKRERYHKLGKKMPKPTKFYNRCQVTGRPGSYINEFGVCRIVFRKAARE